MSEHKDEYPQVRGFSLHPCAGGEDHVHFLILGTDDVVLGEALLDVEEMEQMVMQFKETIETREAERRQEARH